MLSVHLTLNDAFKQFCRSGTALNFITENRDLLLLARVSEKYNKPFNSISLWSLKRQSHEIFDLLFFVSNIFP